MSSAEGAENTLSASIGVAAPPAVSLRDACENTTGAKRRLN